MTAIWINVDILLPPDRYLEIVHHLDELFLRSLNSGIDFVELVVCPIMFRQNSNASNVYCNSQSL